MNMGLLRAAPELAPAGMEIQIYARLGDIPPYNDDVFVKGDPEPVADMKKFIGAADALLIVSPEYNYGVPGVLKNAIDWASRPAGKCVLNRKPAALMGCSPGLGGTIRCQHALRQSFVFTETHVMSQPEIKIPSAAAAVRRGRQTYRREHPSACQEIPRCVCSVDWTLQGLSWGAGHKLPRRH